MNGVALLCDVRGSRGLANQSEFSRRLQSTVRRLTERYDDDLLTRFEIQAGIDEFGAVLRPGAVGKVLVELWERTQSVPVRCALALGEIDVLVEVEDGDELAPFSSADGSALHRGNQLLDELRNSGSLFAVSTSEEEPVQRDRVLSVLGEMTYLQVQSWTERQAEIFFAYRRLGVQTEAARELGIQQSTVSHTLSGIEYRPTLEALDVVIEELNARTAETTR